MVDAIGQQLKEVFDHTHGTITENDCYIFMSDVLLGRKLYENQCVNSSLFTTQGCQHNLIDMLTRVFEESDYVKEAVIEALRRVMP